MVNNRAEIRIAGLDVIRSVAILIVIYIHFNQLLLRFFPQLDQFNIPDGVTLFFVLSGFLIGQILLNTLDETKPFDTRSVFAFIKRRWWRTLPNYYLFLFINIILAFFHFIPGTVSKDVLGYFYFGQTLFAPRGDIYLESWSLCIEEWFYLLFPFLLLFFIRLVHVKEKLAYFISCLLFILMPLVIRLVSKAPYLQFDVWDAWYRKRVITSIDCIGYGMLMALLIKEFPGFFKRWKLLFFGAGACGFIMLPQISFPDNVLFYKLFFTSTMAISCAFVLPMGYYSTTLKTGRSFFTLTSKLSYSLYLCHLTVLYLADRMFPVSKVVHLVPFAVLYLLFIFLCSYVIYRYFERPLMNQRDK
ncbi:MAG: acyltransferase [Sediminibacterium sp.]|nr:acyltransferase [Sediminibacterium sp.]